MSPKPLYDSYWQSFASSPAAKALIHPATSRSGSSHCLEFGLDNKASTRSSIALLWLGLSLQNSRISAGVTLQNRENAKAHFDLLMDEKDMIEADYGENASELMWDRKDNPESKIFRCVIFAERLASPIKDLDQWPDYHSWMGDSMTRLQWAFWDRLTQLPN
ncbi:MAG: DUF4268 domain-containing protein [Proteobacteria bacterium]|nr:DUF4268 domain-containing protein [Pseudomonadota bacterium]MDA1056878.1 DUF4268 domain-containing protein [Pseudomonadota bacterium]